MATVSDLGVNLHADGADETIRALTRVGVAVDRSGASLQGFASTAVSSGTLITGAMLAVGAAAVKMAEHGVRSAADLQHAVAAIATIKPDLDMTAMTKTLNDMSTRIPQSSKAIAESVYEIFSSIDDISAESATNLAETFAKGATAARTDARTFGDAITGVLNAYKLDVSEADKVSDAFFNTVNRGKVSGAELAQGLGTAISAAKALGVGYEEAFAMIVGVTKEGGPAAQNLNNFANLMGKLNTKEAANDFALMGIAVADATGKLREPRDVLHDLKARLDGMSESAKATALLNIFPDVQARQGAQTIMSQLAAVDAALAENRTQTGSTARAYQTMSATAIAQGELLKNTWTALTVDVAEVALPALTVALGAVADGVRNLRTNFETTKVGVQESSAAMVVATEGVRQTVADLAELSKKPIEFTVKVLRGPEAPTTPEGAAGPTGAMGDPFAGTGTRPPGTRGLGNEIEDFFGRAATQYGQGFARINETIHQGAEQSRREAITSAGLTVEEWDAVFARGFAAMEAQAAEGGAAMGAAVADGIERSSPQVINASQAIVEQAGRLLAGAGGKVQDAITAAANMYGDQPGKLAQVSNELLSQANAVKALQSVYSGLNGEQEANIRVVEAQQGASAALKAALDAGYISQAQYADGLERGTTGLRENALAARSRAEAEEAVKNAQLGGLAAMQAHTDQRERERIAALGGEVAIRANAEAKDAEKVAALGGVAAMQAHTDQRERERVAALGGEVAIRASAEAKEDEKTAALGGAAAMRDHTEQRERERTAALGGALAIRDHEEEMAREREQALGGALAVQEHNEQLERERIAALGGAGAIIEHTAAIEREKAANQGAAALLGVLTRQRHQDEADRLAEMVLTGQITQQQYDKRLTDFDRWQKGEVSSATAGGKAVKDASADMAGGVEHATGRIGAASRSAQGAFAGMAAAAQAAGSAALNAFGQSGPISGRGGISDTRGSGPPGFWEHVGDIMARYYAGDPSVSPGAKTEAPRDTGGSITMSGGSNPNASGSLRAGLYSPDYEGFQMVGGNVADLQDQIARIKADITLLTTGGANVPGMPNQRQVNAQVEELQKALTATETKLQRAQAEAVLFGQQCVYAFDKTKDAMQSAASYAMDVGAAVNNVMLSVEQHMTVLKQRGQDLLAGASRTAFGTTSTGLTASQIYGGTATVSGQPAPAVTVPVTMFQSAPRLASGGLTLNDGLAYLHRGETVTPAGRGGGATLVVNYHAPAISVAPQHELRQAVEQLGPTLVNYLREAL